MRDFLARQGESQKLYGARMALAALGTLVVLAIAWQYLSLEVIEDSLSRLVPQLLLAAAGLYFLVNALRALRFMIIVQGMRFDTAFCIAAVHSAMLRIMPLRSGELVYGILLKRAGQGTFGQGMASILMLRILDLAVVMALAAVILAAFFSKAHPGWSSLTAIAAAVYLGVSFFFLSSSSKWLRARLESLPERKRQRFWVRAALSLTMTFELSPLRRWVLLALSLVLWLGILIWVYVIALGIGVLLDWHEGMLASLFGVVGSFLPLSLFGSFGPQEGGFAIGLKATGIQPENAVNQALVISSLTFINNWIVAILAWLWLLLTARMRKRRQSAAG